MKVFLLCLFSVLSFSAFAVTNNEEQAKQILTKTLKLVENPGGAQLDYEMRATSLFTQIGHAVIKGSKTFTESDKSKVWFDGATDWWLDTKKNTVTVFGPDDKRHIGMGKQLQIAKTGCSYALENDARGYLLRLKVKKSGASIKEATILVDKTTYAPLEVRFKWMIFWLTVKIKNFRIGNYPDTSFKFVRANYPNVKIVDKRKK